MELIIASSNLSDYLTEIPGIIEYRTPFIQQRIKDIEAQSTDLKERTKIAFEIARDEVLHSFDTQNPEVSISGEEALKTCNGICFAKAHLLATLLRGMKIPTGFCYQRVLRDGKNPESGHALHGLNAVYFEEVGWFRVDPRGNKAGIDSQFNWQEEQLAYPIRPELGEVDYEMVFTHPLESVIESMRRSETSQALFFNRPEVL